MRELAAALLLLSFMSGCAVVPARPDRGIPATSQTAVATSPVADTSSLERQQPKKSFGVTIDLSKFAAYSSANKPRSIQSETAAFDLALSGIDDTDNDGKVDRVRYMVTTIEGSKEYERNLSAAEIVMANADPVAIEMIRKGAAVMPAEYVQNLNEKLQNNEEIQSIRNQKGSAGNYRTQLTMLALGCIWAVAGANASVAIWCLASGWAYWACLVGALGFHTALSVMGCLAL